MKKQITLLFCLSLIHAAFSQTYMYQNYSWDSNAVAFKPTATDTFSEMVLQNKIVFEAAIEKDIAYEYYLHHTKVFINSPQVIERNNTVYFPAASNGSVLKLMVRVIKPSGDVIVMNENDIKDGEDKENDRKYKYMAVRGLEIGSVVEKIFVTKTPSDYTGRIYSVQFEYPAHNTSFEFIYPNYLIFDIKTYNGFPKLEKDTTYKEQGLVCQKAVSDYIAPLKEEKYANHIAHEQKVLFKLTGSTRAGNLNLNSYDKISDVLFQKLNSSLTKAEEKSLDKVISETGLSKVKNEEEKIRKLEDYLKTNVYSTDKIPSYSVSIDQMLTTHISDESSLTRLYVAAFNKLKIEHELLVTCDHTEITFEKNFEAYNYLDNFFIHFPQYDKYLTTGFPLYRYGIIPFLYRNNYGLFIKKTTLGNLTTGLGTVRFVAPDDYLDNTDSLYVNVEFADGFENAKLNYRVTFFGQSATGIQGMFDYLKEDKEKEDLRKSIIERYTDDEEVNDLKSENEGAVFLAKKPYVVSGSFTSSKFIDKAGVKYLFKVGDLIGPQEQLYQTESRKMPIEMPFPKNYRHTISFKIPQGFKITNIEKLNMDVALKEKNGSPLMAFHSWYEVNGDDVIVNIVEYYKITNLPIERYEDFKNVINASADFNKIVLLFETK